MNSVAIVSCLARKVKLALAPVVALAALGGLPEAAAAQEVAIPNFWDPKARLERPDLTGLRPVRFLVDDEFPPLSFLGPDGNPTGFTTELARAVCEQLTLTCTVQVRRFDTLLDALQQRNGDVVAAGIPITAGLRGRFGVTQPFFKIPARFVARKGPEAAAPQPGPGSQGRTIAVVGRTAHEAYAKAFYAASSIKPYPELGAAQAALKNGEVDYLFADGLSLALWIGGTEAANCCAFTGGPFLESRFFGEGIGFILRKEDETLRRAFEFALQRLWDEGRYAELYLRFFPVSPF